LKALARTKNTKGCVQVINQILQSSSPRDASSTVLMNAMLSAVSTICDEFTTLELFINITESKWAVPNKLSYLTVLYAARSDKTLSLNLKEILGNIFVNGSDPESVLRCLDKATPALKEVLFQCKLSSTSTITPPFMNSEDPIDGIEIRGEEWMSKLSSGVIGRSATLEEKLLLQPGGSIDSVMQALGYVGRLNVIKIMDRMEIEENMILRTNHYNAAGTSIKLAFFCFPSIVFLCPFISPVNLSVKACGRVGKWKSAIAVFDRMVSKSIPRTITTYNIIFDILGKLFFTSFYQLLM